MFKEHTKHRQGPFCLHNEHLLWIGGFQGQRWWASPQTKLEKRRPSPSLVYWLSFAQFLDACGIRIMLFDIQQFCQDSLNSL